MSPIVNQKREKFTFQGKYLLFILTVLCCVMMVVTFTTDIFNKPLNYVVGYVVVPYQRGISAIGNFMSERKDQLITTAQLMEENAQLKEKITELENENTKLMQDKYELNTLRELYELDTAYESYSKIGARVIYKDSGNWFATFIVDKGYKDGLKPDMNVVCGSGLVGKITTVGPNWSKITSIISDNSNVSATVLATNDDLIVSGSLEAMENKEILFSQLIDTECRVADGDKIVTSDISDKYLPGILIGYVSDITEDPNNLTKSGKLIPAVDFEHIEEVLIILEMKQEITKEEEEKGLNSQNYSESAIEELENPGED